MYTCILTAVMVKRQRDVEWILYFVIVRGHPIYNCVLLRTLSYTILIPIHSVKKHQHTVKMNVLFKQSICSIYGLITMEFTIHVNYHSTICWYVVGMLYYY